MSLRATFLGTGTSVGVPMIGCTCPVCRSKDARNIRSRSGFYIQADSHAYLIDTSADLRLQAIANGITRVEALLYTHSHADHILGLDDVRRFNTLLGNQIIPLYACPETLAEIQRTFNYIGKVPKDGLFRALIDFRAITEEPFDLLGTRVTPIRVRHNGVTHGYRVDWNGRALAYIPDCKEIPQEEQEKLGGLDVLIIDALRYRVHKTHFSVWEALTAIRRFQPKRTFLTHLCHDIDHSLIQSVLPPTVSPAYDSLTIEL